MQTESIDKTHFKASETTDNDELSCADKTACDCYLELSEALCLTMPLKGVEKRSFSLIASLTNDAGKRRENEEVKINVWSAVKWGCSRFGC